MGEISSTFPSPSESDEIGEAYDPIAKTHRITLASDSGRALVDQLTRNRVFFKRMVVAVPSYASLDAVTDLLRTHPEISKDTTVRPFFTRGYLFQKHFDVRYEYGENTAPWEHSAKIDDDERHQIESTDRWKTELEPLVSTDIFIKDDPGLKQIAVILAKALCNPERLGELQRSNFRLIVLNPGISDFQEYYGKTHTVEGRKQIEYIRRPVEDHLPTMLRALPVTYITERQLIADLVRSSYAYNAYEIHVKQAECGDQRDHSITLFASDITYKKHRGVFPLIFEHVNHSIWQGLGICVGDGIASPYSFNRIHILTESLTGPMLVKVGQPHPVLMRSLELQLGGNVQDVKKALVIDNVSAVLRRVESGESVCVVADPQITGWLREIPAMETTKPINIDVDIRAYRRMKIDERENPAAPLLQDRIRFAATLTKSRKAFERYVENNSVEGDALVKLMVELLVSVTYAIRTGEAGMSAQPKFELDLTSIQSASDGSDGDRSKLIRLCKHVLTKYVGKRVELADIHERYAQELRGIDRWDRRSERAKVPEQQVV